MGKKTALKVGFFFIVIALFISIFFWINGSDVSVQRIGMIFSAIIIAMLLIFLATKKLK